MRHRDLRAMGEHVEANKQLQDSVERESICEHQDVQIMSRREGLFSRFGKRRSKTFKERGAAYRVPMQEDAIDENKEASYVSSFGGDDLDGDNGFCKESSKKLRRRRKKLEKKAASFDYADLRNEDEYPSRINVRRTAICAKSKSTDAIQLETFIVVSRLKQFDLL